MPCMELTKQFDPSGLTCQTGLLSARHVRKGILSTGEVFVGYGDLPGIREKIELRDVVRFRFNRRPYTRDSYADLRTIQQSLRCLWCRKVNPTSAPDEIVVRYPTRPSSSSAGDLKGTPVRYKDVSVKPGLGIIKTPKPLGDKIANGYSLDLHTNQLHRTTIITFYLQSIKFFPPRHQIVSHQTQQLRESWTPTVIQTRLPSHDRGALSIQSMLNRKDMGPKLTINSSKTNVLNCSLCTAILMADSTMEEVSSSKFLGMYLDRGLTCNEHIDHVCVKIYSGIFVLGSLAKYCPSQVLITAYYGLIYPHSGVWSPLGILAFTLKNKAIRIVAKIKFRELCVRFQEIAAADYILDANKYETPEEQTTELVDTERCFMNVCPDKRAFKTRLKRLLVSQAFYNTGQFLAFNWEATQLED
ncbi:hypothetical protein J6590_066352 [Homalodisca vitripennis]|nr:hypothetical protein J6590_066352 [Homalodisca vitripennis]